MAEEYGFYITTSYVTAGLVLLWMLLSARHALKQSEADLKRLQTASEAASEEAIDSSLTD